MHDVTLASMQIPNAWLVMAVSMPISADNPSLACAHMHASIEKDCSGFSDEYFSEAGTFTADQMSVGIS